MRKLTIVTSVALTLLVTACVTGREHASTPVALRGPKPMRTSTTAPTGAAVSPAVLSNRPSRGSAAVGNFVRAREQQLQFCYREARVEHPQLSGSATIAITLADDGSVREAGIVRSAWAGKAKASRQVESCVLARVRSWQFPAGRPDDEHVHSFAVIFSS